MATVVFDIETVGIPFDDFDEHQQEYWLKFAKTPEEAENLKETTALSALTGFVCSVALLNPTTGKGKVCSLGDLPDEIINGHEYEYFKTEKDLLAAVWNYLAKYTQFVTFNGRGFDVPYLVMRSAINHIRPTKNLMGYRYDSNTHCDLADQLSFYGAVQRKMPLHFYLKAFDIPTSKDGDVKGFEVTKAFYDGKIRSIAEYCMRDVVATAALYDYWQRYMNF